MIKIKPTKEVDKSPKNGPVIKKKALSIIRYILIL